MGKKKVAVEENEAGRETDEDEVKGDITIGGRKARTKKK